MGPELAASLEPDGRTLRCVRCRRVLWAGAEPARPFYCPRSSSDGAEATVETSEGGIADTPDLRGLPGRYALVEELGRGGMGVVYRATDRELGRQVALKLLPASDRPSRFERFLREARMLAAIDDPGVIRVFDAGQTPAGGLWIAMGLVRGPSLDTVLREAGGLPPAECLRIGASLARTLGRLHVRDVCHRDIKPANVLLTFAGAPLFSDFGLALDLGEELRLTREGGRPGTPAYMAPELLDDRDDPDWRRADVYALGLVVAQMLTGEPPGARARGQHPDGRSWSDRLRAQFPPDVAEAIGRAVAADPAHRHADGRAFAEALERCGASGAQVLRSRLRWLGWRHRRWVQGGLAAAGVLAAVGAGTAFTSWRAARAATVRETAAMERLDATWARRQELLAGGRTDEAETSFRDFVGLEENHGTEAWAQAWLRRGEEEARTGDGGAADAFGEAFVASNRLEDRRTAATGLMRVYADEGRWALLRELLGQLDADPALADLAPAETKVDSALASRDLPSAIASLGPQDPRFAVLSRLLASRVIPTADAVGPPEACARPDVVARVRASGVTLGGSSDYGPRLLRLEEPGCRWVPVDGPDDARAWLQSSAAYDIDGDGQDDALLGLGPPAGYGVRVLRGDGAGRLVDGAYALIGNVEGIGGWTLRSGERRVAASTSGRHPNRWIFPEAPHWGEEPGIHLFRWDAGALTETTAWPTPRWDGAPIVPGALLATDLDGDGDEDLVIGGAEWVGLLIQADPQPPPMWIGGMGLIEIVPREGELPALHVRIDGADRLLGEGDEPLAAVTATTWPTPAGDPDDPAWGRAARLASLGLLQASADEFARLGRTRAGASRAAAWRAAGGLLEAVAPLGAADADLEAARAGWTQGWAAAARTYQRFLQHDALEQALAAGRSAALPAADRAALDALAGDLATHTRAVVNLGSAHGDWALRAPYATWADGGGLDLHLVTGVGPVARLALHRTAGPLGLRIQARFVGQEWANGLAVTLRGADGEITAYERVAGDSVADRLEVGLEPAPWFQVPRGGAEVHVLDLVVVPLPGRARSAEVLPTWDGVRALPRVVGDPGDITGENWSLDLSTRWERNLRGPRGEVRVTAIELWGLSPAAGPEPLPAIDPDADAIGRLRLDPEATSRALVRERGLAEALALVGDAWEEAVVKESHRARTTTDLALHLPLLAERDAPRLAPMLSAWRALALVEQGRLDEAQRAIDAALPWAGDSGETCMEAHATAAAVRRARKLPDAAERAAALECVSGAEARWRLAAFEGRSTDRSTPVR